MKTRNHFSNSVLARAVQLALLAMIAAPGLAAAQGNDAQGKSAQGDKQGDKSGPNATQQLAAETARANGEGEIKHLICPTNYFEIGALDVSRSSTKFGEYNGLGRPGPYAAGNFSVSGGDGYCQRGGLMRWDIYGTDLGTTSRSLGFDVGEQGKWTVGLSFDQLRHYTTTGYQTPYQGGGSNRLLLPPSFGVIATGTGVGAGAQGITARQLAAFNPKNVYNQRRTTNLSLGYAINSDWNFKFDYKHLDMSGAKLISSGSDSMDTATPASMGGLTYAGQDIAMLLNPTKSSTDTFDFAFNWAGKNAYATLDYYGSIFHDDYKGLSWSNSFVSSGAATGTPPPNGSYMLDSMSTPPSNMLNQVNFSGGYIFSPKTLLTGGLSVGLNTQNSSFDGSYTPSAVTGLPANSLHGKVVTTHADARLTHQFTPDLNLNVGFKYNERNNTTASNKYSFYTLGGALVTPVNAPMSNRREQADVTLDYRIDKHQRLNLGYSFDHIDRWCNNAMANNAQGLGPASYYVTAACAQVPRSTDNSLNLGYSLALFDSVNFKAGYAYSDRNGTINPSFYNPMQSASTQGYENYGWLAFFQAPRREHKIKFSVNWDATAKLNFSLNNSFTRDEYYESALGVQNGNSDVLSLAADYTVSDNASFGAYLSWERIARGMLSAADRNPSAPPVQLWENGQTERDIGIGLYGKQSLLRGKLQLAENLSYDLGKTSYNTQLFSVTPAVGNSGEVPIINKIIELRLTGSYVWDKHSGLSFGYIFQRLLSNDYMYNAFQFGYNPVQMLPNGLQAPNHTISVGYLMYRYTF